MRTIATIQPLVKLIYRLKNVCAQKNKIIYKGSLLDIAIL